MSNNKEKFNKLTAPNNSSSAYGENAARLSLVKNGDDDFENGSYVLFIGGSDKLVSVGTALYQRIRCAAVQEALELEAQEIGSSDVCINSVCHDLFC